MKELISASLLKEKKEISNPKKEKKSKLSDEGLKSLLESFNRVKKELPIL